jgi:rhodanese-related sulfurtransferase
MTELRSMSPDEARRLLDSGAAVLIDIREPDEHAREAIPGARSVPLSRLDRSGPLGQAGQVAIFHCRSGSRTAANAGRLAAAAAGEPAILAGGLMAWKAAGQPTRVDRRQPIEVMRQVQIVAGSLVLLGVLLGAFVSPWFLLLSGFVGAGLVFAGSTGWCGMALLLAKAPWNRPAAPGTATPAPA